MRKEKQIGKRRTDSKKIRKWDASGKNDYCFPVIKKSVRHTWLLHVVLLCKTIQILYETFYNRCQEVLDFLKNENEVGTVVERHFAKTMFTVVSYRMSSD